MANVNGTNPGDRVVGHSFLGSNPHPTSGYTKVIPGVKKIKKILGCYITNSLYRAVVTSFAKNYVVIDVAYTSGALSHADTAVAAHTAHTHDIVFAANPVANAVTMAANALNNASAGDLTVVGGGTGGGIETAGGPTTHTVTQPTAHAKGVASAVLTGDAVDLSAVTINVAVLAN
jgi:hypothetical protein